MYESDVAKMISTSSIHNDFDQKAFQQSVALGGEEGSHWAVKSQSFSGHHQEAVEHAWEPWVWFWLKRNRNLESFKNLEFFH